MFYINNLILFLSSFYKLFVYYLNMKKYVYAFIIAIILLAVAVFIILRGNEDYWIKDSKGIYIKYGKPSNIPDYVKEQQEAIICGLTKYEEAKKSGIKFESQCLGSCGDYAVDIVHVSRTEEDNKVENQCLDYREGKVSYFIELDSEGKVVRIG